MAQDDLKALERFVLDNPDLEALEASLDNFNQFVAMGWTRQEVRHSSFLRWLLDPRETHGLGSYFLRLFLKNVATRSPARSDLPSVFDLECTSLGNTAVLAEWSGIDVFIRDEASKILCVIETKLDSGEHNEQLSRYRQLVERQFPGYQRIYVYLAVEGEAPSDPAYALLRFEEVVDLLRETIRRRKDQLGGEVLGFMGAYVEMMERHIMEDSEIQEICQRIYFSHRRALDLIFEHRPDRAYEIRDFLVDLVSRESQLLVPDHSSKAYVRFAPADLEFIPRLGKGWTSSGRLIAYELDQSKGGLFLKLILGPGPSEIREAICAKIKEHPSVFNRASTKLYPQWWTFHGEKWLTKAQVDGAELPELKDSIGALFERLVRTTLQSQVAALAELRDLVIK